jgi:hypothetical protein
MVLYSNFTKMMKIFLIIICTFGFISSSCLAGPLGSDLSDKTLAKAGASKEIKGKVEGVVLEDLVNEVRPKIIILTGDGKKRTFVIRPTTTIYDPEWNPSTLDKIPKGQFVRIKYRMNKEGFTVALSIKPSKMGSGSENVSQGINVAPNK